MCNAYNHDDACECGFGGTGHKGISPGAFGAALYLPPRQHSQPESVTSPTTCPICGAYVFFHSNGNGDAVYFDELGHPWPKHACFEFDDTPRLPIEASLNAAATRSRRPDFLNLPRRRSISDHLASRLAMSREPTAFVVGVVSESTGWSGRIAGGNAPTVTIAGAVCEVLTIASKNRLALDVYFRGRHRLNPVGEVLLVQCTSGTLRDHRVLVAVQNWVIKPGEFEETLRKCLHCGKPLFAYLENDTHRWCDCQLG